MPPIGWYTFELRSSSGDRCELSTRASRLVDAETQAVAAFPDALRVILVDVRREA